MGIIFLFIGVAVVPSIDFSVVKASDDNNLVEVTSQTCGIQGFNDTTVKLTKQQYQDLERYLVDFRARLNQTTTRAEAVPIFKEAVVEMNKYGLMPKGMSVEQAQCLITGQMKKENRSIFFQRFPLSSNNNFSSYNILCLIAGETNNTFTHRGFTILLWYVCRWIVDLLLFSYGYFGVLLALVISIPLIYLWIIITTINNINPLALFDLITVGYFDYWHGAIYGNGWVQSFGLLGSKKINGNLMGAFTGKIPLDTDVIIPSRWSRPAIYGFTGFKLFNDNDSSEKFYLGSAIAAGFDVEQ